MAQKPPTNPQPPLPADTPEAPSATEIRDELARALFHPLVKVYGDLLLAKDDEVRRKAAKDVADILGLDPKAPGGSHQQPLGLSLAANLPPDAFGALVSGFQTMSKGVINNEEPSKQESTRARELPQAPSTPEGGDAAPWRAPSNQEDQGNTQQ